MKYVFYCDTCKKISVFETDGVSFFQCKTCINNMRNTLISYDTYTNFSDEQKNTFKKILHTKGVDGIVELKQQKLRELKKEKQEAMNEIIKNYNSVLITTMDLHEDYEIIGPVYFQINDHGSTFHNLMRKYSKDIEELTEKGQRSNDSISGLEVLGLVVNTLSLLGAGPEDRDLLGNSHSNFDLAFFIACNELRKRTLLMGGDAVIGMRQDIDLDTNGFQHFYLQMYGTAVKRKI